MKGAYTLIIRVNQPVRLQIKSLEEVLFGSGLWVYVGSAMGTGSTSLENRLSRHFRKEKTIYWHIDYLLEADVELVGAVWAESNESVECDIAQTLAAHNGFQNGPKKFGSSDCKRGCIAHTYYYQGKEELHDILFRCFRRLNLIPHLTDDGQL